MKKFVAFDNKDWHGEKPGEGIMWYLRGKNIAWSYLTKWYYAAIGFAFIVGGVIGYVLPHASK